MIELTEVGTGKTLYINEQTITLVKYEDVMSERTEMGSFKYVPCNRTRIERGSRENVYVTETPEEVMAQPPITWSQPTGGKTPPKAKREESHNDQRRPLS